MKITSGDFVKYLNKGIADICPHKYVGQNNCAHFVGHALDLQVGLLCNLVRRADSGRASIRVNDIYNNIKLKGLWSQRPKLAADQNLLIFVTSQGNFDAKGCMGDSPYKHIGVVAGEKVYNYSNHHHKVMADSIKHFYDKCNDSYPADDITLYYGLVK
jgi:hypothetical protein